MAMIAGKAGGLLKNDLSFERSGERVCAWFLAPVSVYPLVVCRIGLGAVMFLAYLHYAPHLETLLGDDGLVVYLRGFTFQSEPKNLYWYVFALLLVSALSFCLGFFTRSSAIVLVLCHRFFLPLSEHFTWGWSFLINGFILYTAFSQAGLYYSLDQQRKKKKDPAFEFSGTTSAWPLRLIQIHICMIYIAASWHRFDNPEWLLGEKVFVAATLPVFARFLQVNWLPFKSLFEIASYVALAIEVLAPLCLWFKRIGAWFAVGLIVMHVLIEVVAMVGWWSPMMCVLLFVFLPAQVSHTVLEKILGGFVLKSHKNMRGA